MCRRGRPARRDSAGGGKWDIDSASWAVQDVLVGQCRFPTRRTPIPARLPLATRAASGIDRFDELMTRVAERAPTHHLVTIEDVGAYAAFLASDAAKSLTGSIAFIDGGYNIVG